MLTPQSAKQRRKRCQNCNKLFVPARNVPDQKFCKDECRWEFHRHGSAFGPMKAGLYRAIDKKYAALERDISRRHRAIMSEVADQSRRVDLLERLVAEIRSGLIWASNGETPVVDRSQPHARTR